MKLQRLQIKSDFRSLKVDKEDFEIEFRYLDDLKILEDNWQQFHPFCLAGLNGTGKSNLLEALANIFYHLESCVNVNQPENFTKYFSDKHCSPDSFELDYFIVPKKSKEYINNIDYTTTNLYKVSIIKKVDESPTMEVQPFPFKENDKKEIVRIKPSEVEKKERRSAPAKSYLPNLVIGYSSGENEILSIPFLKTRLLQFDEYKEYLLNNLYYEEPESSMIYVDYEMSQAVLLCNLIFHSEGDNSKDILKPLKEKLEILDITRFRMNLKSFRMEEDEKYRLLDQLINKENDENDSDKIIDKFKNCCTCFFETEEHVVLDFWMNEATKEAFRQNFSGVFELFRAFQLLYTLNYHFLSEHIKSDVYQSKGYYTGGKIPSPAPEQQAFHFLDYYIEKVDGKHTTKELLLRNISDGEQQFLHTLGICLMLKNRSALLLLDEPETHFNPDWRAEFIRTLKNSLEASNSNNLMRDILLTSHSPFIISDCLPDNVFVFRKDSENEENVICERPNFNTYGSSVDLITEQIFNKKASIGDLSKSELDYDVEQISTLEDIDRIKFEVSEKLGDSLEKVFLFDRLNRKKRQLNENRNA